MKLMITRQNLTDLLSKFDSPVKRRAVFVGLLSREIIQLNGKAPIVVGGEAVEIYTEGGYTTGDIDIITSAEQMSEVLRQWGFVSNEGNQRLWINEELDLFVDWRGGSLSEGSTAEERANTVVIAKDLRIKVLSLEDLIVDRLCAAKFWQDGDSRIWASVLYRLGKNSLGLDTDYLKDQAKKAGVSALINDLEKE